METHEQGMAAVENETAATEMAEEGVGAAGLDEQAESAKQTEAIAEDIPAVAVAEPETPEVISPVEPVTQADAEADADDVDVAESEALETIGLAELATTAGAAEIDAPAELERAQASPDAPLELVELELALGLADIPAAGFETALRAALASSGGTLLFIMPAGGGDISVAALSLGSGDERLTFLAILAADGATVRFENAADSRHPVAGLAASWTRVMERMPLAA